MEIEMEICQVENDLKQKYDELMEENLPPSSWKLRDLFMRTAESYAVTGDPELLSLMMEMPVEFSRQTAENSYVDIIKVTSKHQGSRTREIKKIFLEKCVDSRATKARVQERILKKILKLLLLIPKALVKFFKYIRNQFVWKKYGYTAYTLKTWKAIEEKENKKYKSADPWTLKWAHKNGFCYDRVRQYGLTNANKKNFISDRDYILLNPLNSSYKFWIEDISSLKYILNDDRGYIAEMYYQTIRRNGKNLLIRMPDCPENYESNRMEDVLALLREKKAMIFRPDNYKSGAPIFRLAFSDDVYYISGRPVKEQRVVSLINSRTQSYLLTESITLRDDFNTVGRRRIRELRALIVNEELSPYLAELRIIPSNGDSILVDTDTGCFSGGAIPDWEQVKDQLMDFCQTIPQLEYYAVFFNLTEAGIRVTSCNPHPSLYKSGKPNPVLMQYLVNKADQRRNSKRKIITVEKIKGVFWKLFKKKFCRPGYRDYMMKEYVCGVVHDFFTFKNTTLKEKLWCYKHGYYSFRLDQYHLNEENVDSFLNDRDYHWLCPINNQYIKWVDDKNTYRYAMKKFPQYAPKYYYNIIRKNGKTLFIKMSDCPEKYGNSAEAVVELLQAEGALAVKQAAGEHGDGFFKLSYSGGQFFINNVLSTREAIIDKLNSLKRFYNVTEFLTMHEELIHIYPGSVNTIRVMTLNPDGDNPIIANAYLRIGTDSTKMTDNVGYGGLFARVDVEDGHYYCAERLNNHVIIPCPEHPDTGVLIDGYLPDWEEAKKALVDICKYFGQLEYLGFDVALCAQGIKILEINKHQDLHRCAYYGETIQQYFRDKISEKSKAYHLE